MAKISESNISLKRPDIAEGMRRYNEYHKIKDKNINNPDITSVSGKAIICYRCEHGHDTEQIANKFSQRKQIDGVVACPECKRLGIKTIPYIHRNNIREYLKDFCKDHPEYSYLLDEWDYITNENNGIDIDKVGKGTNKKVWWICPDCHNSYDMSVSDRTEKKPGNNCPYCNGSRLLKGFNDLLSQYPEVAKDWDYDKNYPLRPEEVFAHASKKVWWKCENGHSWEATIAKRTNKTRPTGCAKCRNHGTSISETALFLAIKECFDSVEHRVKMWGLEYDIRINDIKLLIEYNGWYTHTRNGKTEQDIRKLDNAAASTYRFLRIIESEDRSLFEHIREYIFDEEEEILYLYVDNNTNYKKTCEEVLKILNKYYGCNIPEEVDDRIVLQAIAQNKEDLKENSIQFTAPLLYAMWHPTKNGDISPNTVSKGSHLNIWWQCPDCGYEFQKQVHRLSDKGIKRKCKCCGKSEL